ncbi:short-chain dehydrogenase [Gordoniibacillus kamchatkensis]|uniref:Short-chain dehydrogenase n=1 Tax=Gordoniibacillus kamchatkensis TaxID=1590651 RepID=A0ABR5AI18_9BACL|nr:SDR family oxidoreductase [Paenibacillus sp. VKM B-2647]KIL40695.1 short-chain dehydrogenase [Paenibacillus sp. VKM B-2647]
MQPLQGRIALVAGATRGAGRAIAVELGRAGAAVYVTGRTTRERPSPMNRPETIEETAELVTAAGGQGIPVRVDHTNADEVQALIERIRREQDGRLDVLVNDVWGGDPLHAWGESFWEASLENGLLMQRQAVHSHIITAYYVAPLMIARGSGLIVEVTDGVGYHYRGHLFYSMAKIGVSHLAQAMAADLKPHGVAALAVTPGFLRSEAMLEHFGVTEANWRDAAAKDVHFLQSETPYFVARAIACLAADPNVMEKSGQLLSSWGLSDEYPFEDIDGRRPHWGKYAEEQGF